MSKSNRNPNSLNVNENPHSTHPAPQEDVYAAWRKPEQPETSNNNTTYSVAPFSQNDPFIMPQSQSLPNFNATEDLYQLNNLNNTTTSFEQRPPVQKTTDFELNENNAPTKFFGKNMKSEISTPHQSFSGVSNNVASNVDSNVASSQKANNNVNTVETPQSPRRRRKPQVNPNNAQPTPNYASNNYSENNARPFPVQNSSKQDFSQSQYPVQPSQNYNRPSRPHVPEDSKELNSDDFVQNKNYSNNNQYSQKPKAPFSPHQNKAPMYKKPERTVNRESYEFEKKPKKKKSRVLLIILIIILVLAGLIAGIILPPWENMNNTMSTIVSPIKTSLLSSVNSFFPKEEAISSQSVIAESSQAPSDLLFTIATSKKVEGLRIVDDLGVEVFNNMRSETSPNTVVENSNILIWNIKYEMTDAYHGYFTIYPLYANDNVGEAVVTTELIHIEKPIPKLPPIIDFSANVESSVLPAKVSFKVTTSTEVTELLIVDEYDNTVMSATIGNPNAEDYTLELQEDMRTWNLNATYDSIYSGYLSLQYEENESGEYLHSDRSVEVQFDVPSTPTPTIEATPTLEVSPTPTIEVTPTPEASPIATEQAMVVEQVTPSPTPEPTPEPTPTPAPTVSPVPYSTVTPNDLEELKLNSTMYLSGKKASSYTRELPMMMLNAFTTKDVGANYAAWQQAGVLTFRSGPLRQNAAYSTADVKEESLSLLWSNEVGSMKIKNGELVHGIIAPGQSAIVKWPTEIRNAMDIYDESKEIIALKEVIASGQDGKIHFFNLLTGKATRDVIDVGVPTFGAVSVATNGVPLIGVGQSHRHLNNKSVDNGYHIYNLINNKKATFIKNNTSEAVSNYTGVASSAIFDSSTGTVVFTSQNGSLYTAELGTQQETYDFISSKIILGKSVQAYQGQVKGQSDKATRIDSSVAIYGNYAYYGDYYGLLQCVDLNTLSPLWAVNLGDTIISTPALDVLEDGSVALYISTNRYSSEAAKVFKINALSGEIIWEYALEGGERNFGFKASPVIGQNSLSDVVIYTASKSKELSTVFALNKNSGNVVWSTDLTTPTSSSPVAVYNEKGEAWILQAQENGEIHLLNSKGVIKNTLKLEGEITASPAVYGDLMVIGTTGRNTGGLHCIQIK